MKVYGSFPDSVVLYSELEGVMYPELPSIQDLGTPSPIYHDIDSCEFLSLIPDRPAETVADLCERKLRGLTLSPEEEGRINNREISVLLVPLDLTPLPTLTKLSKPDRTNYLYSLGRVTAAARRRAIELYLSLGSCGKSQELQIEDQLKEYRRKLTQYIDSSRTINQQNFRFIPLSWRKDTVL